MKPVTVITGGAGGMGFAAANIFGHQGHTLLLCDVKEEALQSAAASLKRQNMDVHISGYGRFRPRAGARGGAKGSRARRC